MPDDPILDEIYRIRAELSDQFHGDIQALGRYLREQQTASGVSAVTRPPKPVKIRVINKQRLDAERSLDNAVVTVPGVAAAQ